MICSHGGTMSPLSSIVALILTKLLLVQRGIPVFINLYFFFVDPSTTKITNNNTNVSTESEDKEDDDAKNREMIVILYQGQHLHRDVSIWGKNQNKKLIFLIGPKRYHTTKYGIK